METILELVILFGFYCLYKFVVMQKEEYEALMKELDPPDPKDEDK